MPHIQPPSQRELMGTDATTSRAECRGYCRLEFQHSDWEGNPSKLAGHNCEQSWWKYISSDRCCSPSWLKHILENIWETK